MMSQINNTCNEASRNRNMFKRPSILKQHFFSKNKSSVKPPTTSIIKPSAPWHRIEASSESSKSLSESSTRNPQTKAFTSLNGNHNESFLMSKSTHSGTNLSTQHQKHDSFDDFKSKFFANRRPLPVYNDSLNTYSESTFTSSKLTLDKEKDATFHPQSSNVSSTAGGEYDQFYDDDTALMSPLFLKRECLATGKFPNLYSDNLVDLYNPVSSEFQSSFILDGFGAINYGGDELDRAGTSQKTNNGKSEAFEGSTVTAHTLFNEDQQSSSQKSKYWSLVGNGNKSFIRKFGKWSEHITAKGRVYYYNSEAKKAQWDRPKQWPINHINGDQNISTQKTKTQSIHQHTRLRPPMKATGPIVPNSKIVFNKVRLQPPTHKSEGLRKRTDVVASESLKGPSSCVSSSIHCISAVSKDVSFPSHSSFRFKPVPQTHQDQPNNVITLSDSPPDSPSLPVTTNGLNSSLQLPPSSPLLPTVSCSGTPVCENSEKEATFQQRPPIVIDKATSQLSGFDHRTGVAALVKMTTTTAKSPELEDDWDLNGQLPKVSTISDLKQNKSSTSISSCRKLSDSHLLLLDKTKSLLGASTNRLVVQRRISAATETQKATNNAAFPSSVPSLSQTFSPSSQSTKKLQQDPKTLESYEIAKRSQKVVASCANDCIPRKRALKNLKIDMAFDVPLESRRIGKQQKENEVSPSVANRRRSSRSVQSSASYTPDNDDPEDLIYEQRRLAEVIVNVLSPSALPSTKRRCSIMSPYVPSSARRQISIGNEHQAVIPETKTEKSLGLREECWWHPAKLDSKQLDEWILIAERHQGLSVDEAMKLLHNANYNFAEAAKKLETLQPAANKWSDAEFNTFLTLFNKHGKKFRLISKNHPNNLPVWDLVDQYYQVKKRRCFFSPYPNVVCPNVQVHQSDEKTKDTKREDCINCTERLWESENTARLKGHWKNKITLCLPCGFYARLTKSHRPFEVPFIKQEKAVIQNPNLELFTPKHRNEHCLLHQKQNFTSPCKMFEWTEDEKCAIVEGFLEHGRNYEEILECLGPKSTRTARDIHYFYLEFCEEFSLEDIISLHDRVKKESGFGNQTNGNGRMTTRQLAAGPKGRKLRACRQSTAQVQTSSNEQQSSTNAIMNEQTSKTASLNRKSRRKRTSYKFTQ